MEIALFVTGVALAGVFAVAGLAKLADLRGTRKAAVDFGAPVTAQRAVEVFV